MNPPVNPPLHPSSSRVVRPPARSCRAVLVPLLAVVVLGASLSACGDDDAGGTGGTGTGGTLTVLAAASLTTTFTDLAHEFEADHPGVEVRLSFGGSSDLVQQIQAGAPADVFASADTANMDKLGDDAVDPAPFATNTLEIAVPPDDPAKVTRLADLGRSGLKLVVCAPEVPCGAATAAVARKAGVTLRPVSEEQSVTDVLGKVSSGEADAGLVYVTDVRAAGAAVKGVPFAESRSVVNTYPIAALQDGEHRDLARQFVGFVTGPDGRQVLADAGFGKP